MIIVQDFRGPSGFGWGVFEKLFGQDYRIYRDIVRALFIPPLSCNPV